MKSRFIVVSSFLFYCASAVLFVAAVFIDPNSIWRAILMIPFPIAVVVYLLCSKCPHCGKIGLKLRPFAEDCGYCNYCGELVEYND